MELTLDNLKTIKPGHHFALFANGSLAVVFTMLAGQRFVQVNGGMIAVPLEKFVKTYECDAVLYTIHKAETVK